MKEMRKEFEILCTELTAKNVKCNVILSNPWNKGEEIDVLIGMDAPDELFDKVYDVLDIQKIKAEISGDMSGPGLIEKRKINGGAINYGRYF
jgi:hypothetical protein